MPFASSLDALSRTHSVAALPQRRRTRRNLLLTIIDAIGASNQRKAEREIARFMARNGGQLTAGLERRIAQRLDDAGDR